jgi:hypothetical protein
MKISILMRIKIIFILKNKFLTVVQIATNSKELLKIPEYQWADWASNRLNNLLNVTKAKMPQDTLKSSGN